MDLIERESFLDSLKAIFSNINLGQGHCVFVSGEAGIGKTSVVATFTSNIHKHHKVLWGTCDALFTPRPLAPLYDVAWQLRSDLWKNDWELKDRTVLFMEFLEELRSQMQTTVIVFEDVHWADEATLDFIKFFARRISRLRCMLIITYRDDEIHTYHPVRNILGQLNTSSFSRIQLPRLSESAVTMMAEKKGYSGHEVYLISGGNPFYVTEILSSYSPGIPDNIKDAILNTYRRLNQQTQQVLALLAVIPNSLEANYLQKLEPDYHDYVETCFQSGILLVRDGRIFFKHELFRRAIETSLSPLKRVYLNKRVIDVLEDTLRQKGDIERIVHHAKNANEYELVVQYVPLAAARAASLGAHKEAATLWQTGIEYYQGNDPEVLMELYTRFAYECYLTTNIKQAIVYTTKTLSLLMDQHDINKVGNCQRFLSRLWWLDGDTVKAEKFGMQALELLQSQQPSPAKAMAFSNMAQLKMVLDQPDESLKWGRQAIAIAREINDPESLSHALNNVGSIEINIQPSYENGLALLEESLSIALRESLHEHAARAYSNMVSNLIEVKNYTLATRVLDEGIRYCEERNLDFWRSNLSSGEATLHLESGSWKKGLEIATKLLNNNYQIPVFSLNAMTVVALIKMRTTDENVYQLLTLAKAKAFETHELQRILPCLSAILEYEWLTGDSLVSQREIDQVISIIDRCIYNVENNKFAFWLFRARGQQIGIKRIFPGYSFGSVIKAQKSAIFWKKIGCPYAEAIALCDGNEEDRRNAIKITHELGAYRTCEKIKHEMRAAGIKSIPRGIRKTTQSNVAFLTVREVDVLGLLKDGLKNKEIAKRLYISVKTVDHHVSSIFFKLEVNSRAKAVNEAVRQHIIR
jgi:DNA-binding CsgD family transcriptional regulator/tetratricopeptide (TPR) repeat protein